MSVSLQSDEKAERDDERLVKAGGPDPDSCIMVGDFAMLFEALKFFFCKEEHMKTMKRLKKKSAV